MEYPFEFDKIYPYNLNRISSNTYHFLRKAMLNYEINANPEVKFLYRLPSYPEHVEESKTLFEWKDKTSRGRFLTRLRKWYYDVHDMKIPDPLWTIISLAYAQSRAVESTYYVEFSSQVLQEDEDFFYHENSCWWYTENYYRHSLDMMGGFGVRFLSSEDENDASYNNPIGRCWMLPVQEGYVIFNTYGLEHATIAAAVTELLMNLSAQKYEPHRVKFTSKTMQHNDSWATYIGQAPPKTIRSGYLLPDCEPREESLFGGYWFLRDSERDKYNGEYSWMAIISDEYHAGDYEYEKEQYPIHIHFKYGSVLNQYELLFGGLVHAYKLVKEGTYLMSYFGSYVKYPRYGGEKTDSRVQRAFKLVEAYVERGWLPRRLRKAVQEYQLLHEWQGEEEEEES